MLYALFCMYSHFKAKLRSKCVLNGKNVWLQHYTSKREKKEFSLLPPLLIMFVILVIILKKIWSLRWGCVIWSIGTLFMIHLLNKGLCLPCTNDYRFTFLAGGITPGWNQRYPLIKSNKIKDMAGVGWGGSFLTNPFEKYFNFERHHLQNKSHDFLFWQIFKVFKVLLVL